MFFGESFSLVTSPDASFTQKFQDSGRQCFVAAEITLKCLHVAQLLLLPVLVNFYFRFAYAVKISQHKSHWLDCTWKHGYIRCIFPPAAPALLTRFTLETSFSPSGILGCSSFPTKIWGTVRDMGKIILGFCSQYISRKSHGSVPKNSKHFWCSGEENWVWG